MESETPQSSSLFSWKETVTKSSESTVISGEEIEGWRARKQKLELRSVGNELVWNLLTSNGRISVTNQSWTQMLVVNKDVEYFLFSNANHFYLRKTFFVTSTPKQSFTYLFIGRSCALKSMSKGWGSDTTTPNFNSASISLFVFCKLLWM